MLFGLKNIGATYQRLVNQIFNKQIGRNMEVYVDDMLVKSREARTYLADLQEAFDTLRRYKMKLNPAKCLFGVSFGKFLGFMVSREELRQTQRRSKPYSTWFLLKQLRKCKDLQGE